MSLTLIIIILTSLISYKCFEDRTRFGNLLHSPYQEKRSNQYYRLLTSGFLHGSFVHLFINMFVLWNFGEYIEYSFINIFGDLMGRLNYLLLYLLTVIFANVPTYFMHKDNVHFSSVGASGAVSGLVFVFILFRPWAELELFFFIPFRAIILGVLYLGYSSWAAKNGNDRIDHVAHFAGAIFGLLFTIVLEPELFTRFLTRLQENAPF